MIIHTAAQNTEEWFALKKGRPSASNFSKIITAAKGDLSKSCKSYIEQLIAECFCPEYENFFGTKWTDRGIEMEPEARACFAARTGFSLQQVGFCTRDDEIVGCSPDSLIVSPDGTYIAGLEMKCPSPAVHVGYVNDGVLPDDYKQQVHGSMAVTGLNEWHFFSYFPGMQPFHLVVKRDDYTEKLSMALDDFIVMYQEARTRLIPKLQLAGNRD